MSSRGALGAFLAMLGAAGAAHAFPAYAQKEGVACAYCHVSAKGGGPRNYRGKFYKTHDLSFAGFDDAAEAAKAGVAVGPAPTPAPKSYTPAPKPDEPKKEDDPKKEEPSKSDAGTKVVEGPKEKPSSSTMTVTAATARAKAAEAAYLKAPKNPAKKKAYAEALAGLGHATMLDAKIPPRQRYPAALRTYRRALALDPTNKVALDDKRQIEEVYKNMGRPVPQ